MMSGRRTRAKVVADLIFRTIICWIFIVFVFMSVYNETKDKDLKEGSNRTITTTTKTIKAKSTNPKAKPIPELFSDDFEYRSICSSSLESNKIYRKIHAEDDSSLPKIYVITPTYGRPEMIPELTRLGQSLLLVPKLHWIIAEDSYDCTETISDLLNRFGLPYTHLTSPMPKRYRKAKKKPRGVSNRRAALEWIKKHGNDEDVLYFLDDDNTVNVELFDEIRFTKKVSMFPVGLIGKYRVSSPIVKKGKVVGFYDGWPGGRKFQVDMAGFAINVGFLRSKRRSEMPYKAGFEENGFLKSMRITFDDIEPKADNCTKILVWHTKTVKKDLISADLSQHSTNNNIIKLAKNMQKMNVINKILSTKDLSIQE
ncbi:UNVERIFIED_CONTAM: hypothetical protein RMT77_005418 [Armadillidium vulgare]